GCTTPIRKNASYCCYAQAPSAHSNSILAKPCFTGPNGYQEAKMKSKLHDEAMAELYANDPALALDVINGILEDGDHGELLIVLRHLAQAFGGVQAVAKQANLNPTQLYRTLSPTGNPGLNSLTAILRAMGLRLAIQPLGPLAPIQTK